MTHAAQSKMIRECLAGIKADAVVENSTIDFVVAVYAKLDDDLTCLAVSYRVLNGLLQNAKY